MSARTTSVVIVGMLLGCSSGDPGPMPDGANEAPDGGQDLGDAVGTDGEPGEAKANDASITCMSAGLDPLATVPSADLPHGTCPQDGLTCRVNTKDPCPGTPEFGPLKFWQCSCASDRWSCVQTGGGKGECLPDAGSTR
jgi:hypothetical protein